MSAPTGVIDTAVARIPRVGSDVTGPFRFAVLGDSTSGANSSDASASSKSYGADWPTYLTLISQGRFALVYNGAVSGYTTAQMLARVPNVIASGADVCFVLGGANDADGTPTLAESKANLQAIYTQLRAAGIQVVALTQLPHDTYVTNTQQRNAWIKVYCRRRRIPCIDLYAAVVDITDGGWNTTYSGDGVHPNAAGARLIAQEVNDAFTGPALPSALPLATAATDQLNLLSNGLFYGDSNADGVANSWSINGSAGTHTWSLVSDADNVLGNWQQDVVASAGLTYLQISAVSGFSVGDRILFCCKFATSGAVAGSLAPQIKLLNNGGSGSFGLYLPVIDIATWGYFEVEGVVPASTTALSAQVYANVGTGTWRVGQVTLVNLTTLGVV
mgnify:CR=1 FL=1|jgi:lysophospholipase L1-like esterase